MTRAARHEGGFTLIELLVALIIIATLTVLMVSKLGGTNAQSRQKAMVAVAEQIHIAASSFNADFPRRGTYDPLINFTHRTALRRTLSSATAAMPSSESAETDRGFFTRTGRPLMRSQITSPYGKTVAIMRLGCPATGQVGYVYICRPAARTGQVRVTAWAANRTGAPIRVYDKVSGE